MLSATQKLAPQPAQTPHETMQILVIDDSETDRQRILRLCEQAGLDFVATEVETIDGLRDALSVRTFDLVFIDYVLAGEDGLQAIDVLNERAGLKTASIMVAGEGQIGIAVEAMRRGCSDYLTKADMTVATLQKSVATAIERRMLSLTLREERELRYLMESNFRKYAHSCSAEMRSILAAALRRVRTLRETKLGPESAIELTQLEASIDRLWKTLPKLAKAADHALADSEGLPHTAQVMQFRRSVPTQGPEQVSH